MSGVIEPSIDATGLITVNMGFPDTRPVASHFHTQGLHQHAEGDDMIWELPLFDRTAAISLYRWAILMLCSWSTM